MCTLELLNARIAYFARSACATYQVEICDEIMRHILDSSSMNIRIKWLQKDSEQ